VEIAGIVTIWRDAVLVAPGQGVPGGTVKDLPALEVRDQPRMTRSTRSPLDQASARRSRLHRRRC